MRRIALTIAIALCALTIMAQSDKADMAQVRKLVLTHSAIVNLYVDEVDEEKMVEASIKAMLKELEDRKSVV